MRTHSRQGTSTVHPTNVGIRIVDLLPGESGAKQNTVKGMTVAVQSGIVTMVELFTVSI